VSLLARAVRLLEQQDTYGDVPRRIRGFDGTIRPWASLGGWAQS
jgi:hypothetical protein